MWVINPAVGCHINVKLFPSHMGPMRGTDLRFHSPQPDTRLCSVFLSYLCGVVMNKQGIVRYGTWWQLACHGAQCGGVPLFFQWRCAYDDVHDETGSAGRVSRLVTVPTDPFTRQTASFLSEWAKCQPGNTQNGGTVLPIENLMVDSESGSQDSYSSFLVTIRLSRLASEIFACDRHRWTDGRTTRNITIAGPTLWRGS